MVTATITSAYAVGVCATTRSPTKTKMRRRTMVTTKKRRARQRRPAVRTDAFVRAC